MISYGHLAYFIIPIMNSIKEDQFVLDYSQGETTVILDY